MIISQLFGWRVIKFAISCERNVKEKPSLVPSSKSNLIK